MMKTAKRILASILMVAMVANCLTAITIKAEATETVCRIASEYNGNFRQCVPKLYRAENHHDARCGPNRLLCLRWL